MPHLEVVAYSATAPGSSGAAASVIANTSSGASLTVKNSRSKASILGWYGFNQAAGFHQLIAQSLHDTTRNMRVGVNATEIDPRLPKGTPIQPEPQELLQLTIAGSAVAGDVEIGWLQMLYKDLPGVNARMMSYKDYLSRLVVPTTIQATLTGAAAGVTGVEGITAETDLLKANRDYAVLGATTNTDCAALLLSGPDFGNVYIGVPGDAGDNDNTCDYFCQLSRMWGADLIPYFNSGNKAAMNFAFIQNENNVSPLVTWYLGLLK